MQEAANPEAACSLENSVASAVAAAAAVAGTSYAAVAVGVVAMTAVVDRCCSAATVSEECVDC